MLSLNTDNLDLLAELLLLRANRRGQAGQQAAAANTHDDGIHIGHLLQNLQANRALARDNVFVIEGVHEDRAGLLGVALRLRQGLVHGHAVQLNLGTVIAGCGNLRQRRAQRHVDAGLNAQAVSRQGHTLRVVTRARGHHAALLLLLGELCHAHIRAAHLERTGALQVLTLEEHLGTQALAQGTRMGDRGAFNNAFEQLCGTFNIGNGHGQGVEIYAHGFSILTVRCPAGAGR